MPVTTLVTYSVDRIEVMDTAGEVDAALMPDLSPEKIRALYDLMVLTRRFDERMLKLQRQGRMGTFARVAGQEGAHVGAAFALRDDDWMVPSFREAGAFLARGMDMMRFLQYWAGDERGNVFPEGVRMLPASIPVGTHMLHAVGLGWAMRHRGEQAAVLTVFGEGATSEGDFSEAMNFAAVFQAPVVFLCQNNQWAISVPYHKQTQACSVAQKAVAYGMPGVQVDGNDVFAVYGTVREALDRARGGGGPSLVEAHTYRVTDHTTADDARRYRDEAEVVTWRERDPIARLTAYMKTQGHLDEAAEQAAWAKADATVAEAVTAFEALDPPGPEEIFAHVFAEITPPLAEQRARLLARLQEGS
ncbi:MAG TPA: pyruvate dehydrogenase (acetyl-transferring) E1 component subunit alpha [Thermoleophilia bacterium]|nr:pyruvate dehydrogenase (acetyl-transferring) E1 component subunit alpha [Thermoleophilia bacterium]